MTGHAGQVECGMGWKAALTLGFERAQNRTLLARRRHQGPLQIQRVFYPEQGDVCHGYILHPPGGVVAGDSLEIEVEVGEEAEALLTTPAAGKFYRSRGEVARVDQQLKLARRASLEWFPQENIIFQGAQVHTTTRVELAEDGQFMGWEIVCLGRPAAQEVFTEGECRQVFEIWRAGRPLWLERSHYTGASPVLNARWGMADCPVAGSFVCVTRHSGVLSALRELTGLFAAQGSCSVTQLDQVIVCRYLGGEAEAAKKYFTEAWKILRPAVLKRPACFPRIWNT